MARPTRRAARGFTYLWLLFAIAVVGAMAAAIGSRASTAAQRGREAELSFRGEAMRRAIASYWAVGQELPRRLDDLVEDRRSGTVQRHLRRLWTDPFTGRADWVLLFTDDGSHLRGLHSRAEVPAFDTKGLPTPARGERATVSQRLFVFDPAASEPAGAASASARASAP